MNLFSAVWVVFGLVWLIAALRTKQVQQRAPLGSRMAYMIPIILGSYLLFARTPLYSPLYIRFVPRTTALEWTGLVLTGAGIAFAIWARFYIGQNWSSAVQVKVDHELIRNGPYSLVRHPIYSGILLALVGTAFAEGRAVGFIALAFYGLGFWIKSRMEEELMRKTFGNQYLEYSRTTGALVPKLRF
ncbi:MAG TPA: isoprenylcysteine carboxylmethyltransferase family protein [Terriglobales bacterium]|nr:isoprenylcysteine carboxylmethyltransferase family protein [Terriglobales bacterium]